MLVEFAGMGQGRTYDLTIQIPKYIFLMYLYVVATKSRMKCCCSFVLSEAGTYTLSVNRMVSFVGQEIE